MKSAQLRWVLALGFAVLTVGTSAVQAEVWQDVFIGMRLFDYQLNAQRNYLGDGWDLTSTAVYAGQEYDFGFGELTLGSAGSPVASTFSAGFTRRGIPKAEFSWSTGGRPLPYSLTINNGIQDLTTINGSILVDVDTDVNILGFYDTRVQISNRGSYVTEGFLADEEGSLAFDVGTINVSGNIYADALAVVTQPLWAAAGTENPFTKFTNQAAKTASVNATMDELRARIEAGEVLTDEEMATLVNSTLVSALLGGEMGDGKLLQGLFLPTEKSVTEMRSIALAPEPTTALLLFGAGGLAVVRRSRRR